MEKKNVVDRRNLNLKHIMEKNYIPYLDGRPERATVIGKDDIANIKIVLNTATTIEELLHAL